MATLSDYKWVIFSDFPWSVL